MMSRKTGKPISRAEHIQQSIGDILSTPIGSRVMRREYGSLLPELMDAPINGALVVRIYTATVAALTKWEPRITVERVSLIFDANGKALLSVYYTEQNKESQTSIYLN